MTGRTFRAILGDGGRPVVELPFDVKTTFGSARPKVRVTVNGVVLRTTVAVYGGRSFVGFRKQIQQAAGIAIGDEIDITIEADDEPRVVDVPVDLAQALDAAGVRDAFDRLPFTHRREHVEAVQKTKKPETRARRIERAIEMVSKR